MDSMALPRVREPPEIFSSRFIVSDFISLPLRMDTPSVIVLAHLFDRNEPGRAFLDLVDGSVRTAQPDRPLARAVSLERLIVVAPHLAYLFETIVFDCRDP